MNVDQLLAMRLCETFTHEGEAPNMTFAHTTAWTALESVLGADDLSRWVLKGMQHIYVPAKNPEVGAKVAFKAEFVRKPDDED